MLYAIRDNDGKIISISQTDTPNSELVDIKNPEVQAFLSITPESFTPDNYLDQSDISVARIVEDLIELMVSRNLIIFTDLPDAAQRKLLTRKLARKLISKNGEETESSDNDGTSILSDDNSWL